jgi:hypothetical protein
VKVLVAFLVGVGRSVVAVVLSGGAQCCFDRCRLRCNLDVLPDWKRLVVESPLVLVSVFYVVEYFFDGIEILKYHD